MSREKLFEYLLEKLGLSREEVLKHQEFYNNHFTEYGNDVYLDKKTRLVHLLNFWEDGFWFNERFALLFKHFTEYEAIVDFGYGLPYLTVSLAEKERLQELPRQVFIDKYQSAEDVSREILSYLDVQADFITESIESPQAFEKLKQFNLPEKKLFVALETIEHLGDSDGFWKNLSDFSGSDIVLSLPIGPKIPSHTIFFPTAEDVRAYLASYLDIKEEHIAEPEEKAGRDLDQYKVITVLGKIK